MKGPSMPDHEPATDLYTECLAGIQDAAAVFQRHEEDTLLTDMVTTPPRKRGGFVRNACVYNHYVHPNRLSPSP